jgi:hypothetical protein
MTPPFGMPTAAEIATALLARRAAYAPDLRSREGGPSDAVTQIAAEYLESLGERIGRMPDKHLAALLDMVGVSLLPAQPAGATVVFTALPSAPSSRVGSGTRLGATIAGLDAPLPYETGRAVAITASALAEVWTVVPGADAAASHGPDLASGRGATLFAAAERVERELLLGDALRLALSGRAEILLDVNLRIPGSLPLALEWSWWDGAAWQPFAAFADPAAAGDDDSWDGTQGLTRSGRLRLVAPCAKAKPLTIEGVKSCWIRARTTVPLPPRPDVRAPEIAALRLRTVLSRPAVRMTLLPATANAFDPDADVIVRVFDADAMPETGAEYTARTLSGAGGDELHTTGDEGHSTFGAPIGTTLALAIADAAPTDDDFLAPVTISGDLEIDLARQRGLQPDKAIGDEKALDITRSFQPLGQAPSRGAAFYLACDDVFAKPGARVTVAFARPPRTAGEEADEAGGEYQASSQGAVQFIKDFVSSLKAAAASLRALSGAGKALEQALPEIVKPGESTAAWYADVRDTVSETMTALKGAAKWQPAVFGAIFNARATLMGGAQPPAKVATATGQLAAHHRNAALIGADIAEAISHLTSTPTPLEQRADALREAVQIGTDANVQSAQAQLTTELDAVNDLPAFLTGALPSYLTQSPEAFRQQVLTRLTAAKAAVDSAANTIDDLWELLELLTPEELVAGVSGTDPPQLDAAQIAWEYWNGSRWRELAVSGDPTVKSFGAAGVIRFDVPDGWEPNAVLNDTRRWLRARLAAGSYSHLRLVSWTDAKSNVLNFMPVVEPRPPVLDGVELFFQYESPSAPPEQALRRNDFQWEDVTARLTVPGPGFAPFRAMPDREPTLYLGFDGSLPADRLGLYVQLQAPDPDATPLAITWEGFDGVGWRTLAVDDGTRGLTAHGVVGLVWPGDASPAGAAVIGATGRDIVLAERGAATRFAGGDRVIVRDARGGEPAVVTGAGGETLTLRDPVSRAYVGGEVVDAPPARFGTPRTWLRARFDATADPPAVAVAALTPNATDVWQTESIADEVTESSDGSPRQVVFVRRPPILEAERIEVRELEGQRAAVDLPILERELANAGMAGGARAVRDARSGEITAVWVRWSQRASLGLSGPSDRHYTVDRSGGRILFGDGVHGRIPPAGANNIQTSYRSGGSAAGNVAAGKINAMISAVPASRIANPLPASGGADGESLDGALRRGPALLRHRRMAITTADAADLAHETCPAVARARVIGARDEYGRPRPGHTRVIVIPDVDEPRPQPDTELRRRVRVALAARAPATAAAGIVVVGPDYVPVGTAVAVRATVRAEPGIVRTTVLAELARFLHPLRGGADGHGFDFGRSVFLSDLARALEALDGVDVVTDLALTRDGIEQGERVDVEPGQLVCAGALSVTLAGGGA